MPVDPTSTTILTAYVNVPPFVYGLVRDLRVRWAFEELGIAYGEDLVDVRDKPGDFAAKQPWAQVPALRTGDVTLFESGAILLHLAEHDARLMPAHGQPRADTLSWTLAALNSVEPLVIELTNAAFFSKDADWWQERKPKLLKALGRRLDPVAARLDGREWLAGPFTIADIAMAHVLEPISRVTDLLEARPVLADYIARAKARPAHAQALADQLAAFERGC